MNHGTGSAEANPDVRLANTVPTLAILLYVVLVDAAIETVLGGSPVRWWVLLVVLAYLVASIAIWRLRPSLWIRLGWGRRAIVSFFILLGLLVLTAWLPGGIPDGLRLLGQPSSRLLAAITATAVALSGLTLLRARYPHPIVKWAVAILAAYGVLAFMRGLGIGADYAALFQGGSVWMWLPWWLQGAVIGSLVIVPAAIIYRIVALVQTRRAGPPEPWGVLQVVALSMSVLIALSGFATHTAISSQYLGPKMVASLDQSHRDLARAMAGSQQRNSMSGEQVAVRLEALFQILEGASKSQPRQTFDPETAIAAVGRDPLQLFRWVRDETFLVPYRGILRGPRGVLMDRLGNSFDRSLLLVELLRAVGQEPRLAHAVLSEGQARDLLRKARPITGNRMLGPAADQLPERILQEIATQTDVDLPKLRKLIDDTATEQERLKQQVIERVAAQVSSLTRAIGHPAGRQTEDATAVDAVRDHWWVQVLQGSTWVDLDPALPDHQAGTMLTAANETVDAGALPTTYFHEVAFRVVIERWNKGRPERVTILERELRPSQLLGARIMFRHMPLTTPDPAALQEPDPIRRLTRIALGQREWLPILTIDGSDFMESSFTDSGEHRDGGSAMSGFARAAERIEDILRGGRIGSSGPGRSGDPTADQGSLVGEWIEYEIRAPGQEPRTVRREVFDLLGPAARARGEKPSSFNEAQRLARALGLAGEIEILPLPAQLSSQFVERLIVANALQNRQALLRLARVGDSASLEAFSQRAAELSPLPLGLYNLALSRRAWSRFPDAVYQDRVNIFTYTRGIHRGPKGDLRITQGIDIVANDVAIGRGARGDPFLIRLESGVLDSNAEALIMAGTGSLESAAELFAQTGEQHGWVTLRSVDDRAWRTVPLPPDARTRVAEDLASGHVVVVPAKVVPVDGRVRVGWWRIDPRTGQSLAIAEGGGGAGGTELTLQQKATLAKIRTAMEVGRTMQFLLLLLNCQRETGARYAACIAIAAANFGAGAYGWRVRDPIRGLGLAVLMLWLFGVGRTGCRTLGGPCP